MLLWKHVGVIMRSCCVNADWWSQTCWHSFRRLQQEMHRWYINNCRDVWDYTWHLIYTSSPKHDPTPKALLTDIIRFPKSEMNRLLHDTISVCRFVPASYEMLWKMLFPTISQLKESFLMNFKENQLIKQK